VHQWGLQQAEDDQRVADPDGGKTGLLARLGELFTEARFRVGFFSGGSARLVVLGRLRVPF
jgi:hypothetical protein